MATTKLGLPTISENMTADVVRDMNALAEAVDEKVASSEEVSGVSQALTTYQNDYEYQTPAIVGAQIQLIKQSNTRRLFFKLDNDLSGNITISTDGGATSKNLVDLDGVQVTSLDKGFAEVVAESNFFILRNRGLSASDMQALIAITNEAEANESVLRSNFVDAVSTTDESIDLPESATWNDILLQIPNIRIDNKEIKYGTATIGSTAAGNVINHNCGFVPMIFICLYNENNWSLALRTRNRINEDYYFGIRRQSNTYLAFSFTADNVNENSITITAQPEGEHIWTAIG